jgi:hypothetical protein
MKKGIWKKERAVGRKYSHSDEHKEPAAGSRKKYWTGAYSKKGGIKIKGHWSKNPAFKK